MITLFRAITILTLGLQGHALAQDAARGEVIYRTCIECHGDHGQGLKAKDAPKIAGQFDWYIESSIKQFKAGERKNPTMLPFIKGLSDQDIKDVSLYVSKLTAPAEEK
jgi:cytochrome c553